jgi:hypothetical protein
MDTYCGAHQAHAEHLIRIDNRLDNHGEKIDELTSIGNRLSVIEETNADMIRKMDSRLTSIESAPAKRMESFWGYGAAAIIGAVVSYLPTIISNLH